MLAASQPAVIDGALWKDLLERLAPVSENYLRELLRATGLKFEQPYAGVRQHSFEELEESLTDMGRAYANAVAVADRVLSRYCRSQVIAAKSRARAIAAAKGSSPEARERKLEMAEWMLVWLENPEVFPPWAAIRKRALFPPAPESD